MEQAGSKSGLEIGLTSRYFYVTLRYSPMFKLESSLDGRKFLPGMLTAVMMHWKIKCKIYGRITSLKRPWPQVHVLKSNFRYITVVWNWTYSLIKLLYSKNERYFCLTFTIAIYLKIAAIFRFDPQIRSIKPTVHSVLKMYNCPSSKLNPRLFALITRIETWPIMF